MLQQNFYNWFAKDKHLKLPNNYIYIYIYKPFKFWNEYYILWYEVQFIICLTLFVYLIYNFVCTNDHQSRIQDKKSMKSIICQNMFIHADFALFVSRPNIKICTRICKSPTCINVHNLRSDLVCKNKIRNYFIAFVTREIKLNLAPCIFNYMRLFDNIFQIIIILSTALCVSYLMKLYHLRNYNYAFLFHSLLILTN